MKRQRGFSLVELVITIAVFAILAALAAPNVVAWVTNAKVGGAARELLSALQDARLEAIKANADVGVELRTFANGDTKDSYSTFIDDNPRNGVYDSGETASGSRQLAKVIKIESSLNPTSGDDSFYITFTSQGFTRDFDTLTVNVKRAGEVRYRVVARGSGNITINPG